MSLVRRLAERLLAHEEFVYLQRLVRNLPRRAVLTWRYQGPKETLRRVVTFPLRLTPLRHRLGLGARMLDPAAGAEAWYRREGRPVAIVIPSFGPTDLLREAVQSIQRTTDRRRVRIIVADDASAPEHRERLRELQGIELVVGEEQLGFAANANRGLRMVRPEEDVVLLNSDVVAHRGWLERLQYGAYRDENIGIAGPKLVYPDGTIQSGGTIRNPGAREWFDHIYRFKPADEPRANVPQPRLAVTGAALYIKHRVLDRIGLLDEDYGMAYEDVDWCLRAWGAGYQVLYWPAATLTHHESKSRGMVQGDRELASQRHFWRRWGDWFDNRQVRNEDGRLRIIYVTEDTGVGGGARVVFQHLNGLAARGHDCELWSLAGAPSWFELEVPVRTFRDYGQLARALGDEDALKVATWWDTAASVWQASVRRGIPVYFVQDIETSYYTGDDDVHARILASYRPEFRFLTTSTWVAGGLAEMGFDATIVSPGLDLDRFSWLGRTRHERALLALGRSNPLKNFPLTLEAYDLLPQPRPELWLYGIEPELGSSVGARYHEAPSDEDINELMNTATVFVQTSRHEGFCLPVLEAMAAGIPVVCTDAHGNRDFCRDGENCLVPDQIPRAVSSALQQLLDDDALRTRLSRAGIATARDYDWSRRIGDLEHFYESIAS